MTERHNAQRRKTTAGITGSREICTEIIRPVPKFRRKKNWGRKRGKIMTLTDTPEKGKLKTKN